MRLRNYVAFYLPETENRTVTSLQKQANNINNDVNKLIRTIYNNNEHDFITSILKVH